LPRKRVVDTVEEILNPYIANSGIELVDIEFVKEGQHRYLRIYIDKDGGVTLDDCQEVSEYLSEKLDELDPIKESYFLEVSSPGVERVLKRDKDFEKFAGNLVEVKLFHPLDGNKILDGKLIGLKDNMIVIDRGTKGLVSIPRDKVSHVKLIVNFD